MKKLMKVIVITAMVFILVACSKEKVTMESEKATMDKTEEPMDSEKATMYKTEEPMESEKVPMDKTEEPIGDPMMSPDKTTDDNMMPEKMTNDGNPAPAFDLKDVKGASISLSDYEGKKVYIKFWASWCSICLAGLEELNTFAGEDQDFVILTVVSPSYKGEKKSESFVTWFNGLENVSNLTVLLDDEGALAQKFGLRGYPTSAFIGSDGVLVKTQAGHLNKDQIKAEFENIF